MSNGIPNEILLGISSLTQSGSNATWSLTKTSQGLSFTVTYPETGSDAVCSNGASTEYSNSIYSDEDDSLSVLSIDSAFEVYEDTKVSHVAESEYTISDESKTVEIKLLSNSFEAKFHFETTLRAHLDYNSGTSDADTEAHMSDTCSEISNFSFSSRISNRSSKSTSKRNRRSSKSRTRQPLFSIHEAEVTDYGVF